MSNVIEAIAVFNDNKPSRNKVYGYVIFKESTRSNNILIEINLAGLKPGKHGFHIHETGNLLDSCKGCKGHFNPFNQKHGGINSKIRHVGDLGNIIANDNGICQMKLRDNMISLRDITRSIIGRSIVIHSDEDDLGNGNNPESLVTGNAGSRIACAVIGYKNVIYFK